MLKFPLKLAFFESWLLTLELKIERFKYVLGWKKNTEKDESRRVADAEQPLPKLPAVQSEWEKFNIQGKLNQLKDSLTSQEDHARLLASPQTHLGSWLNAIPSPPLGTHLSNESFSCPSTWMRHLSASSVPMRGWSGCSGPSRTIMQTKWWSSLKTRICQLRWNSFSQGPTRLFTEQRETPRWNDARPLERREMLTLGLLHWHLRSFVFKIHIHFIMISGRSSGDKKT